MKNFKEIAEKCLAGELSGTFKLASGQLIFSDNLKRRPIDPSCTHQYEMYVDGMQLFYTIYGTLYSLRSDSLDIIDFIPDNMKEQIKIDIPEGKVPVMEQTEKGVVITWKEKELTYQEIYEFLWKNGKVIHYIANPEENTVEDLFIKKVNVLRKLINIRNYFGLDPHRVSDWVICISTDGTYYARATRQPLCYEIAFSKQEHAEQAIKMLGDEIKYLFEPW